MKCLSIRQPWASLIVQGRKDIENRSWTTPHRGLLLIHAGRTPDLEAMRRFGFRPNDFPYGAIIGQTTIVACVSSHPSPWFEGPWGWLLRESRAFPQGIPYRGRLSLFEVPDHLIRSLLERLA